MNSFNIDISNKDGLTYTALLTAVQDFTDEVCKHNYEPPYEISYEVDADGSVRWSTEAEKLADFDDRFLVLQHKAELLKEDDDGSGGSTLLCALLHDADAKVRGVSDDEFIPTWINAMWDLRDCLWGSSCLKQL